MTAHLGLRKMLGSFATGVTVITGRHPTEERDVGLTVNSFSSVSLSPPLVAWSIGCHSPNSEAFKPGSTHFIHVLRADQAGIAEHFATPSNDKFHHIEADTDEVSGVKTLRHWAALMRCETHSFIPAGDHFLVLAEVVEHAHNELAPLLFVQGQFAAVADLANSVG